MHDVSTSRLPPHHIGRPRLVDSCLADQIVVIEAAGGYGKSVLAAELIDAWGSLPIWVLLEEGEVPARLFAARLRTAVARAGLGDRAATMAAVGDDPPGVVDAMLAGLEHELCTIVIDDAHHAARDSALLIDRIADQLDQSQRLLVLARHLPPGLARLRRSAGGQLGAAELALRSDETLALCRDGFRLDVSVEEARLLDTVTGGWTAAAVLAVSRAKRTEQPLGAVVKLGVAQDDAVQSILEDALAAPGSELERFAQLGALPLLDRELLELITGEPDFFDRALGWGLPMSPLDGSWWELPGPVREHLAHLRPSEPAVLQVAAGYYQRHGQLGTGLQMMLAAGDAGGAASLLNDSDPWAIDKIDALELLSVIDRIPPAVLERYPRAMLSVGRSCGAGWLMQPWLRLLDRLDQIVEERASPELRRAVDVELAATMCDRAQFAEAEVIGRRILDSSGPTEQLTRARALSVYGQALCWRRREDGRIDPSAVREAVSCFERSQQIQLQLGNRGAAATLALPWALWGEYALGRPLEALAALNAGLGFAADHPRRLTRVLATRAQVLTELGRHDEALDDLSEVWRIAEALGDRWMLFYVAWLRMILASLRGDADATLRHAQEAEAWPGDWWDWEGSMFLADAADSLDRVGHTAAAREHLDRAQSDPQNAGAMISMAECALLARHGDPELARQRLSEVPTHPAQPLPLREYWRVTLLDANAAFRAGDPAAGALAARAFEQAARLGQPQLPLLRERELTESLLALAVETGMPAALALESAALPTAISVLGRFEVNRGGRPVPLGAGQGTQLLKLIAIHGGGIEAERAIEALWPEAEPTAGRNRLRTVLGRLRETAGDIVARDGDLLALAPGVRLDLDRFTEEARSAQALASGDPAAAVAVARSAIARYRGALLPHDPYEPWAEQPREAVQRTMLALLDLCAETAAERGDLDEARRLVERTIELAPHDDDRYLRVATILNQQGRKGAALSVLRRARGALAQLGIDPPPQLAALEEAIAARGTSREKTSSVTLV